MSPVEGEYFFNLRFHLLAFEWTEQEIFDNIFEYIKNPQQKIKKQNIDVLESFGAFLSFTGIVGIEFINRIDLTKKDYWPV